MQVEQQVGKPNLSQRTIQVEIIPKDIMFMRAWLERRQMTPACFFSLLPHFKY